MQGNNFRGGRSSTAASNGTVENVILVDSDEDMGPGEHERDTHRPDRRAPERPDVQLSKSTEGERLRVPRPNTEPLERVLQVVETPRLNVQEFHIERVHPASQSKCQGRPGQKRCATPVLPGSLQPGYMGTYVYYQSAAETAAEKAAQTDCETVAEAESDGNGRTRVSTHVNHIVIWVWLEESCQACIMQWYINGDLRRCTIYG